MEPKKMTKEEREAFRVAVGAAVAGASAETAPGAAARLAAILVPDPTAPPSRNGIRPSRDLLQDAAEIVRRSLKDPAVLEAVAGALQGGDPEARVVAALLLAGRLPTDEESEERSWNTVRSHMAGASVPAVSEAIADALAHEMEEGAADSWSRAFVAWSADPDPRFRGLGTAAFAHLFGRGKSPEKLFDALELARRLIGDPDAEVRRSVASLLVAAGRRQGPAVERFLASLDVDDRMDVRKLASEVRKRLGA